jgi:hypothetical protein
MSDIPDPHVDANILDMIAADGDRGFGEGLKPVTIPALRIADSSNCDPDNEWYVEGAEEGDLILGKQIFGPRVEGSLFFYRMVWLEKKRIPGQPDEHVQTWGREPRDAHYPKGLGYSRESNGHILNKCVQLDLLVDRQHCRMTLFNSDDCRKAEAFRGLLTSKRIRGADGKSARTPLYAMKISITTASREEERKHGRQRVWGPGFSLVGVYPDVDGPDVETMMLARDLCAEQEAIKYPDPNDGPLASDADGDSYGTANDLPDYAVNGRPDPDNDQIPF